MTESEELQDKKLECKDCREIFTLTAGEQRFFADKGFALPKRCVPCRKKKTAEMREIKRTTENKGSQGY